MTRAATAPGSVMTRAATAPGSVMAEPRSIKDELTPLEAALDSLHSWFTFTGEVEEMVMTFLEQEGERQLPSSCAAARGVMCSCQGGHVQSR
jgi:hypothetical protein